MNHQIQIPDIRQKMIFLRHPDESKVEKILFRMTYVLTAGGVSLWRFDQISFKSKNCYVIIYEFRLPGSVRRKFLGSAVVNDVVNLYAWLYVGCKKKKNLDYLDSKSLANVGYLNPVVHMYVSDCMLTRSDRAAVHF